MRLHVVVAVTVLMSACLVSGQQSQIPTPAPMESGNQPQRQSQNVATSTSKNKNAAQPTPTASTQPITVHCEFPANNPDNKEFSKATTDWWIAAFTGVLAVVAVLQWCSMRKQAGYMREQSRLMRQSLVAQFRPRLIIRNVGLLKGRREMVNGVSRVVNDVEWKVEFVLANVGGTNAQVKESNVAINEIEHVGGELPHIPPYSDERNSLGNFIIKPGEHVLKEVIPNQVVFKVWDRWKRAGGTAVGPTGWYLFGYIQYCDDVGIERRIGFCFRYDSSAQRFSKEQSADYNYQD